MPRSSEIRTSDSSTISSRQLKQGKGKRSTGSAQTSPTDVLGSIAGPPHSLWIKVSMSLFQYEPTKSLDVLRSAQSMVAVNQIQFNRKCRIPR